MTRRPSFELDEPDENADVEVQTDRAYLRAIATRTATSHGIQSREPGPLRKPNGTEARSNARQNDDDRTCRSVRAL